VPALTGPVVDTAGLLSAADRESLAQLAMAARQAHQGSGVQLQYLIIPSLEGEPIESFSIRVAERWKLGSRGPDNGLLFVVSRDDRRMRIEVGGGLEGGLTDAQAGRIIRGSLVPAFRAGQFGAGLHRAGLEALAAVGGLPEGVALAPGTGARARPEAGGGLGTWVLVVFGLVLLLGRIFGGPGRRRSSLWMAPFLLGGGGGGGRRGGSGGWGGGGGGFSGGGASGNW